MKPVPGGYCSTYLPAAGMQVWQGARFTLFHSGSRSPSAVLEIMIVVEGDVGVDAAETEPLEQMRLPQIADIVIDPAGFAPARDIDQILLPAPARKPIRAEDPRIFAIFPVEPPSAVPRFWRCAGRTQLARHRSVSARSRSAPRRRALRRSEGACPWSSPPAAHLPHRTRTPRSRGWASAGGPAGTA